MRYMQADNSVKQRKPSLVKTRARNQSSKVRCYSKSQSACTRVLFNVSSLTLLNFQIRRLYDRFLLTGKLKVANIKL